MLLNVNPVISNNNESKTYETHESDNRHMRYVETTCEKFYRENQPLVKFARDYSRMSAKAMAEGSSLQLPYIDIDELDETIYLVNRIRRILTQFKEFKSLLGGEDMNVLKYVLSVAVRCFYVSGDDPVLPTDDIVRVSLLIAPYLQSIQDVLSVTCSDAILYALEE